MSQATAIRRSKIMLLSPLIALAVSLTKHQCCSGIGKTVFDEVLQKLKARHDAVTALGNDTTKWRQRQKAVRAQLREVFAPLPPSSRQAPRAVTGGNTTGDGFHVRRLLIETRPGYWCPAALFMPDNAGGRPIPAVLFPSGHSDLTFREPASQIVSMNLVKRGFAVMGFGKSPHRIFCA